MAAARQKKRTWAQCVAEAKKHLKKYNEYSQNIVDHQKKIEELDELLNARKMNIAHLALEAFKYQKKNHKKVNITQFAKDAGMPRSTLQDCLKTLDYIKATKDKKAKPRDVSRTMKNVPDPKDVTRVRVEAKKQKQKDAITRKIDRALDYAQRAESNIKDIEIRLSDSENLFKIKGKCEWICNHITAEMNKLTK